jgi:hypothetical protein
MTVTMTTGESSVRDLPTKLTVGTLLKFQRKAVLLAAGMAGAGLWVSAGFGRWGLGFAIVAGVALGLLNPPSSYNPTTGLVAVVVQSQASFNLLEVNCIATVTCPRPQGSSASSSRTGEASCWVLRGEKGRIGPLSRLCLRTGI